MEPKSFYYVEGKIGSTKKKFLNWLNHLILELIFLKKIMCWVDEEAPEKEVSADIFEKDYVLGWLLAGISAHKDLSQNLIFKGGTCLKKCHLETYHLSEDLDYTF